MVVEKLGKWAGEDEFLKICKQINHENMYKYLL